MSNPKHADNDSELLNLPNPMALFWQLGALATGLIIISTWAGLVGAMAAGWLAWQFWPFIAGPIAAWLVLLALPVLFHARRGAIAVIQALATTAEAWLARAGYSIDLNQDGYIGPTQAHTITVEPPEIVRPLIVTQAAQGLKLLASDAPSLFDTEQATAPVSPPPPVKVWELPNGANITQTALEDFIDKMFLQGWGRAYWVKAGKLDRNQHDGVLTLLEQAGVLTGRGKGTAGKLTLHTPQAVKAKLRLSPTPPGNLA